MPGCCVPQRTNHCRKGTRMYRFPASPNRRKRWLVQVKRDGWEPTAASRVCAAHFEDGSFEQNRLDGLKKLRPGAVPTLFPYRAAPKHRKSPRKRALLRDLQIRLAPNVFAHLETFHSCLYILATERFLTTMHSPRNL
ncbi:THAP domain-containing protein 7-like [Amblyomma americanum]